MDFLYFPVIVITGIISILFVNRDSHISYKILTYILVLTMCNELFCLHIKKSQGYTLVYYNMYTYIKGIGMLLCFYFLMPQSKLYKVVFYTGLAGFAGFLVYHLVNRNFILHYQSNVFVWLTSFAIISCIIYLFTEYNKAEAVSPMKQKFFFISCVWLLFHLCNMPILSMFNYLLNNDPVFLMLQSKMAKVSSIIMYPVIAFDIINQWKQQKSAY